MSDDVARAVGASGATTINIAGKECTVRPMSIRELTEVQRECVKRYKREYLETFSNNVDLLPKSERTKFIIEKHEEAAKWDIDDLPHKYAYDISGIEMNRALRKLLTDLFGIDDKTSKNVVRMKQLCVSALDQGMLSSNQYRKLVGNPPVRVRVPYVNWWITGCYEGMITFVWVCFRHDGVTWEDVADELGKNPQMLAELTREIEHLTAPAVGNG